MPIAVTPAEHAILGLLDSLEGPGHGYDLARNFADGQPLGDVLRLEPGMLYHHLKKMERNGWVESSIEQQSSRPARQLYSLTDTGRSELQRWLSEPVKHTREIRLEFLVKLYFARRIDVQLAGDLIAGQRDACQQWEASLVEQRDTVDAMEGADNDRAFMRIVLDLRLAQTRAAITWLNNSF